ncbi:hypothetical protein Q7P37_008491 [Cladosporium fusiforme]
MFRPTRICWQAIALTNDLLKSQLPRKWFAERVNMQIGLAVSGGVDSMALATLCSQLRREHADGAPSFTGFIVDHGLRPGSREEALQVAKYLTDMDMHSEILTLDWQQHGITGILTNPETIARTLRYRALGKACRERGIQSILFAHHADDQAETTLMRLANKYLGRGLAGMQPEAHIPECEAMYGVDDSGEPKELSDPRFSDTMLVESGGVRVLRPLLSYTKDRLIATCEKAGARWVEDQTNKDPSLTLRNTVRQLHEGNRLPKALSRPSLCAVAARTRKQIVEHEREARRIFQSLDIKLDPRTGSAILKIADDVVEEVNGLPNCDHIKVILLRMLLQLVAPMRQMDLTTLELASQSFLSQNGVSSSTIALAGAAMARLEKLPSGLTVYELRRTAPIRAAKTPWPEVELSLPPSHLDNKPAWSEWQLWDERYWIRIGALSNRSPAVKVVVRLLTVDNITSLYDELRTAKGHFKQLRKRLASVKGHLRTTLPVLVQIPICGDGPKAKTPSIVALPSITWSRYGWYSKMELEQEAGHPGFCYDIRYRHIDESLTKSAESGRDL